MKDVDYKSVVGKASFGFAVHEPVYDSDGLTVDFIISWCNESFKQITGSGSGKINRKKVSELFPGENGLHKDVASLYTYLKENSREGQTEFFFVNTRRWYSVQKIIDSEGRLSLLINEITLLKNLQNELDMSGYMLIENESLRKMTRSLTESEDKYRSLTEQLPVGVYRTALNGQVVHTNKALVNILGYDSIEEFLKLNVSQLYSDPENRQRQFTAAEMRGGVVLSEFQLRKKNGDLIWVRDNTRLIFDSLGNPGYFDGIIEDITDERNSQLLVKENEANLHAIIENTLENIWSVNLNYEINYVNKVFANAFMASFGIRLAKGVNIIEALPEDARALWKSRYDRAFRNEHFQFEDVVQTLQGPVYIEVAMNPIVVDAKVIGVSVYSKDVSEMKINQLQLQYQADLRKLLVELSSRLINLPINEINTAINQSLIKIGEFVGADRAYVFDYNFVENTSSNTFEWCREGITPQIDNLQKIDLDRYAEIVSMHKAGELVKVDNYQEVTHHGLRKLLEDQDVISILTIPLMRYSQCIGFVGFDSVLSQHKYNDYEQQLLQVYAQTVVNALVRLDNERKLVEAKEKAEESDRLKSAFLANMSHEIRTPMSGILGFLTLLNEPDLSEENKSTYINIVTQSGQRLLETINDIIEISKIESGTVRLDSNIVNIRELFGYYDGFFRQQADQKGLDFRVVNNLPASIQHIRTDKKKLDSIISNLLKNAIKFTPSGSIVFKCELRDNSLLFSIKDTGVGIPSERHKSVFDRFVQADISTTRPHEGSGLGLSIVKAYIEMMKGSISMESQPGRGTEFVFDLPCIVEKEGPVKNIPVPGKKKVAAIGAKILVAEDDYASYLYIQKALEGEGFSFTRTTNGDDTVAAVRKDPGFSLVLMDIKMPGMSGLEATKKIRGFNTSIPIIAQTAYSLAGDRELALEAGCNDYIPKPINKKDLQTLVRKYLLR